jgi:hypothetical protein
MTLFQKCILVLLVIALLCAVWMGRYQLAMGEGHFPRVLDRWTGDVFIPRWQPTR